MAQQNRDDIKANFRTGDRPTEEQFVDVFDSYVNIAEDQVEVDPDLNLSVGGSITLTNNGNARNEPGTLRWNGSSFEAFDPATSTFVPLGSGEGLWSEAPGSDIFYDQGNVAIGPVTALSDRLEVELDNTNRRVRTGNSSMGNGPAIALRNHAVFSHTDMRDETNYALVQGEEGDVRVNAASEQILSLRIGNQNAASVAHIGGLGYFVVNAPETINSNSAFNLQVNGSAFKSDSQGEWNVTSDIRVKKRIKQFNDGLQKLRKIRPIQFQYNGEGNTVNNLKAIGISAQELAKVFPYMVQGIDDKGNTPEGNDDFLTTNTSSLKFVMLNAINELAEKVENLEKNLDKVIQKLGGIE